MKVSVSLPADDVEFLDNFAERHGHGSRSAAVHQAVRLLRVAQLGDAYDQAWREWSSTGEDAAWELAVADGLDG